ncbi:MAG TPA: PEGA domain-containing protein [Polyangiaceae bacterium]
MAMLTCPNILVWPLMLGIGLTVVQSVAAEVPLEVTDSCVSSTPDLPTAYELFNRGAELYKVGNYEAASQRLIESFCLAPSASTIQLLASCREKQYKFASAYVDYVRAEELAMAMQEPDVMNKAKQRAKRIESLRSYLTIRVDANVPGLEVQRNGVNVGSSQLGNRLPIDPGEYVITARAQGYKAFEQRVTIGTKSDEQTVVIPALQPLEAPLSAQNVASRNAAPEPSVIARPVSDTPPQLNSPTTTKQDQRLPWLLGGVGVAAVVLGGVSGALALHDNDEIDDACHAQSPCSDPHALSIQSRRDFEWTMARVALPIGLAAIAGAATWLTLGSSASKQPELTATTFETSVDERGGTVWVRGGF